MKNSNLHAGHRQRIRKRFIEHGLDSFEEHQILEFLLFYAIPMKDTNELAHKMLNEFGSLYNLCQSAPKDIMKRCNVTENTACLISLIPEMANIIEKSKWKNKVYLGCSSKLGEYAVSLLMDKKAECFYVICLDNKMRLKGALPVAKGNDFSAQIYIRDISSVIHSFSATNVVFAHNHLNGILEPSQDDIDTTKSLAVSLDYLDTNVLDHIIVCDGQYYSMKQHGKFKGIE